MYAVRRLASLLPGCRRLSVRRTTLAVTARSPRIGHPSHLHSGSCRLGQLGCISSRLPTLQAGSDLAPSMTTSKAGPAPRTDDADGAVAVTPVDAAAKKSGTGRKASTAGTKRKSSAEADHTEDAVAAAHAVAGAEAPQPAKKVRGGRKKAAKEVAGEAAGAEPQSPEAAEDTEAGSARKSTRARKKPAAKVAEEKAEEEGEAEEKAAPKKKGSKGPSGPRYSESMRPPPPDGEHFKIVSWNVAGLRALLKKDPTFVAKLLEREKCDILCIQEIKISEKHVKELQESLGLPEGWHAHWVCSSDKAGYAGVATFSRVEPLSVQIGTGGDDHDGEGRMLITEFKDFYLMNVYVPNSGEGLKRLDYRVGPSGWDETMSGLVKKLQKSKPVIVTGDLNCAHQEIDIHNPKTNLRSAGFTQEERDSFGTRYLAPESEGGCGLVDLYRAQYPEVVGYTYYSYRFNCRAKGIGWRLDYFLASKALQDRVHDSFILPDVEGSDHVPLGITVTGAL